MQDSFPFSPVSLWTKWNVDIRTAMKKKEQIN